MRIAALLLDISAQFETAGTDAPRREAELLLATALGKDRSHLLAHPEMELDSVSLARAQAWAARRAAHEPLAYLRGDQEFMGHLFRVTPAVLIPRPETELLVEAAGRFLATLPKPEFLEIGAGSGCIAVSLLLACPGARGIATEISPEAAAIAEENRDRHGLKGRLRIEVIDFWPAAPGPWPLIVSNPPYISTAELDELPPDVRDHEPYTALAGGPDGLDCYCRLLAGAKRHLAPGGRIYVEHGATQREALASLAKDAGMIVVEMLDDLAGLPRVMGLGMEG
jgi:release factor glutamine methyltransferase